MSERCATVSSGVCFLVLSKTSPFAQRTLSPRATTLGAGKGREATQPSPCGVFSTLRMRILLGRRVVRDNCECHDEKRSSVHVLLISEFLFRLIILERISCTVRHNHHTQTEIRSTQRIVIVESRQCPPRARKHLPKHSGRQAISNSQPAFESPSGHSVHLYISRYSRCAMSSLRTAMHADTGAAGKLSWAQVTTTPDTP